MLERGFGTYAVVGIILEHSIEQVDTQWIQAEVRHDILNRVGLPIWERRFVVP